MKTSRQKNKFGILMLFGLLLAVQVAINSHTISHSLLTYQDDCVICHAGQAATPVPASASIDFDQLLINIYVAGAPSEALKQLTFFSPHLRAPPLSQFI